MDVIDQTEETRQSRLIGWLKRIILPRVWFVHSPVVLLVGARPSICLKTLAAAARPSTDRLHLRNLFANGRRYQIEPREDGFRLTTTSKVIWHYRRRTSSTAVMRGEFSPLDDSTTRLHLKTRINVGYLLDTFLIPGFMTTIVVFMPWHPLAIGAILLTLYTLSWIGHRSNAALEANEMVWFVQKALEDYIPAEVKELQDGVDVVHDHYGFEEVWEKFYEEHQDE